MYVHTENYLAITAEAKATGATLVAVSKTKPAEAIRELYELGHRDFGENYVQELVEKQAQLPPDIRWHFIGHLQTNKVKYIAPFVHLIHGVDSLKLLKEINKQAQKNSRVIDVLLQLHIAQEETKFGFGVEDLDANFWHDLDELKNVCVAGLMGMASNTTDENRVREEFRFLKTRFDEYAQRQKQNAKLQTLSMGMSADYKIALQEGSNLVRIGSLLFGAR